MSFTVEPFELKDEAGKPTGRWRQTMRCQSAPHLAHPLPLCKCKGGHENPATAAACLAVQAALPRNLRTEPDDEPQE